VDDVFDEQAMSPIGPSRHFAAKQRFGRFQIEADIKWLAGPAGSVANDPSRTSRYVRGVADWLGTDRNLPSSSTALRRKAD
jgi:hypothetical protein